MRDQSRIGWFEVGLILAVFVLVLGGKLLYAKLVYGDASCAFANCVKIENVKGAR